MPTEKPLYPQNLLAANRVKWIDMTPHELVGLLGGDEYRRRGEPWASTGETTIVKNQKGDLYVVTAMDENLRWRLCESNDRLRDALLKSDKQLPGISDSSMDLSDAHLEQLKADAVEVRMSHRCWVSKDLVIYDTARPSGEQAVIRKGWWSTTTARFPFFHRDGQQASSALPGSAQLTTEDIDEVFGCDCYDDNLLIWAALSGNLDPTTRAPWLLYVGKKLQLREQPLVWSAQLLDPSNSPNYDPTDAAQVAEQLSGRLIVAFDNVQSWSAEMFDALLGIAPPADAGSHAGGAVRPILAGEERAQYPQEMLAHCVPIKLVRPGTRQGEHQYCSEARFQEVRGALLGSLFNALAYSMAHREPVDDERFSRSLWPFVSHGRAVAEAIGSTPGDFDDALLKSLEMRASLGESIRDDIDFA